MARLAEKAASQPVPMLYGLLMHPQASVLIPSPNLVYMPPLIAKTLIQFQSGKQD